MARPPIAALRLIALAGLLGGCEPAASEGARAALAGYAGRADIRAAMLASPSRKCGTDDARWRADYDAPAADGPIAALLARPLSRRLAAERAASGGRLVQLIIMDRAGCLVAADAKTHDLDQSDEPKWRETAAGGVDGAVFESEVGRVEQLSQALYGADGRPIGAITLRWRR